MKKILLGMLVLAMGYTRSSWAADVKVSGLIFSHFEYVTSEFLSNGTKANDQNAFDVSRVYLNASSKLDDRFDAFGQLETNLNSRDNTANQTYVKQAWVKWNELYPGAQLRFGLVPTLWRGFEEGIWKNRFVAKTLDEEEGLLPGSDRGISLAGKIPYLTYDMMVSNGEGTGARGTTGNDGTKYKDNTVKLSLSPYRSNSWEGFKINGLWHNGQKIAHWPRDRVYGGLSYESDQFNAWGAYYTSRDGQGVATGTDTVRGQGFSFHTTMLLPKNIWIFARFDRWDPNRDLSDDAHDRMIYGIGKKLGEAVRVSLDHQLLNQEKRTATRKDQSIVFTHVEVKF